MVQEGVKIEEVLGEMEHGEGPRAVAAEERVRGSYEPRKVERRMIPIEIGGETKLVGA